MVEFAHRLRSSELAATKLLWTQRVPDTDVAALAGALLGLSPTEVLTVVAEDLLACPETDQFLLAVPALLDRVVMTGTEDADSAEQQLLRWALQTVASAGQDLHELSSDTFDDVAPRSRRDLVAVASGLLGHDALVSVSRDIDVARQRHRVEVGTARLTHQSLLDFCQAQARGLRLSAVLTLVDMRTAMLHQALAELCRVLWEAGYHDRLVVEAGIVRIGPVRFRHPKTRGHERQQGIMVGMTMIDVPGWPGQELPLAWSRLRRRSEGLHPLLADQKSSVSDQSAKILALLSEPSDRLQSV